ncbi:hypothetical protein [Agrococcus baldri]|uniref:Uncharacterized protein n=1 Tax=Agrococcus baldri TaxID=153730 RepID=A0AA87RET9_9MICO|nr:hypothetical protein [Agrococcus baldri]GEK79165.1 hypothetical protein ABA31_05160 [Agrococcus baldri]
MPDRADGTYVSQSDALALWWPAARDALLEVGREGATITEQQLAERIQAATGVTTRPPVGEWIGRVLERVTGDAESRGEATPAARCVRPTVERARRSAPRSSTRSAPRSPAPAAPRPQLREVTCSSCFMLVPAAAECRECGAPLEEPA